DVGLGLSASRRRLAGVVEIHRRAIRSPAGRRHAQDHLRERGEVLRADVRGPAVNLLRPHERDVVVDGRRLHLLDWGGDGRPPLLLLHGFTGHAHAWDTLAIALQPHFHVYALDARGHGDSDPADVYDAAGAFKDLSR